MKTIHLVLNAHLDPIWLWSWRDGLDEILNTSAYICGLLDRHPDLIYTRGEAWLYEQIRLIDPKLFARIRRHVRAGRWSPVGGWYIQPDCNLPSGFALQKQIELGREWFLKWLGRFPRTAYNVDSFGHAATLPGYMRAAGQDSYVMMRPQENEMALPARLFRWRGYAGGPEVTTFRIGGAYCTPKEISEEHIQASLTELPPVSSHTMCFVGIGDHGGGPVESTIAWCRENRDRFTGWRLTFSSPERFFAAVRREKARLPLVTGELQMHAIGCYSVHRPVKVALRKAEHRLFQAAQLPGSGREEAKELARGWRQVCFHHFHDTLGGTCYPSAYAEVEAQLGEALSIADRIATRQLRKSLIELPPSPAQRLVFFNASDLPFDDYIEIEPWLEWSAWKSSWRLIDEKGFVVPCQAIDPESCDPQQARLILRLKLQARERKILRIVEGDKKKGPALSPHEGNAREASVRLEKEPSLLLQGQKFSLPRLMLFDDPTDTWSHGIDRYAHLHPRSVSYGKIATLDAGPLLHSQVRQGKLGASEIHEEWRIYPGMPWVELLLRVIWNEKKAVLKLEWEMSASMATREDGISGGSIGRPCDGREAPLRDWTLLKLGPPVDRFAAVIAPDVFALDVDERAARLTLLRSSVMACHDPNPGTHPRSVFSDRGEHRFRFRFLSATRLGTKALDQMASGLHRLPLTAGLTRGMKNRAFRGEYLPPLASDVERRHVRSAPARAVRR
jgi:alpha-mannosidase